MNPADEDLIVNEEVFSSRKDLVDAALGDKKSDIIFRNAEIFNPLNGEWEMTDLAVKDGRVAGTGSYPANVDIDLKNRKLVPGLIDSHVHLESSLLCPPEFGRLVAAHGTTTVIADPHEIANVCGVPGIVFMLSFRKNLPIDLFVMLPSCVPSTPSDIGGAILEAKDLAPLKECDGVLGLGEVMNVSGVLKGDPDLYRKLDLFALIDGHAPLLSGKDLSAYLAAGIQSDHECMDPSEVREKITKGMFIYLREGSTEKNIRAIVPAVNLKNAPRFSFATDDRHVDMLVKDGHIDDCIRKAIASGLEEEIALRMATLSAAERFGLHDRGALAPGSVADFCVLSPGKEFRVEKTFRRGMLLRNLTIPVPCPPLSGRFGCTVPVPGDILLEGQGTASVIGLIPHQIATRHLICSIDQGIVPDTERDILKVVVCNRYRAGRIGIALVHGFGLSAGAIASSVSHDAHNIIAAGVEDQDICRAISLVIGSGGGLAAVDGKRESLLRLACAGLMSVKPYEKVCEELEALNTHVDLKGGIENSFMYLSFLALTVIPSLRVTDKGLFAVEAFRSIPVFHTGS
jgi:adenine deaminase